MPQSSMLERGVHVLQAFRPDGKPATLGALTARTGLPKPTVYRLAEELQRVRSAAERAGSGAAAGAAGVAATAIPRHARL